jgi:RNA polymerase sigma-32 factor
MADNDDLIDSEELEDEGVEDELDQPASTGKRQLPAVRAEGKTTATSRGGDLLSRYLAEVRQYPLLEPEEERELAERYRETGDEEAAARLVTANLRLVVKLAFQYHRQWSNVLDLIQEGNVGLVEALSRYDPTRGIRFSSYAQYWIRAMILRFLMDNFRMVRLGSTRHGRRLFFQLQKEKDRLIQEGERATPAALAARLNIPEQEIMAVDQHMRAPAASLHAPVGDDEGRSLAEVVADTDVMSPDDAVAQAELGGRIKVLLDAFGETLMDDREKAIWTERLTAQDPLPLSALGEQFGVSKERIRQVEARMRKRLKAFLEGELGDEIDFEFQVPDGE